ncbi:hypothetical protein ACHAXR_013199 [Thalassiosira sp. AJA248-18]
MLPSDAAPANVRVLLRVRPLNDREGKANVLKIDNDGMTPTIDFGMGGGEESSSATSTAATAASSQQGSVSIVDQTGGSGGGYGSGYDSGANNAALSTATARSFTYDAVFGPQSRQIQIFDSVKGIIDAVCAGYNGTIVAYGQTGSGKTHTIFGDEGLSYIAPCLVFFSNREDNNNAGLVQRSLKSIFRKIAEQSLISPTSASAVSGGSIRTTTKASFFEIYNERVYDLLSPNDNFAEDDKGLPVREDATKGVYVEGLVEREVANTMDAMDILRCGMDSRRVAATNMNRVSSRSHAMFVLTVKSELFSETGISKVRTSKFTLVDLAGSERQKTTDTAGDRLKEASMINNSLLCLGQVINSLVDREKGKERHVPFRDSKLTFLLRDSWGGNSKTCLVATVTPSFSSLSETISTLKFAQRAKLIKNTAVLNENTCGSVAALQTEIARLRAELEHRASVRDGGQELVNLELPPAATKPCSDQKDLEADVTVSVLRNQNSKLSKKVKVMKDASNHRVMQVNSLKRKLQQETLIRKCKERRITYLSSKGKTSGMETNDDEIAALREEVTILREQLETQPSESVEWMLKYKEERAKVEEMEVDATNTFEADEKNELEGSLVTLLDERESLQKKVENMSNERNTEIDAIIKDVTKLENANLMLQSQLDKKELVIMANEDKMQSSEAQISELEEEMKSTLDCLEASQRELEAEKQKSVELQESVDSIKMEVNDANDVIVEHQGKLATAEADLKKMAEDHNESTSTLNTKIADLQKNLDDALGDNESLIKKLKEASDDLEAKKTQLESLERDKTEALQQLELSQEKNNADSESFKREEDSLKAEIKKIEERVESLLGEKAQATSSLESVTAQSASLSGDVEALKLERDSLQQRVDYLDKLHDRVASLEDEVTYMAVEKEQIEEQLQLTEADLERTTRLQEHLSSTQTAAHDSDLAICEEIISKLSREKSKVQEELTGVSQQLVENSVASEEKIALLQNSFDALQDQANSLEANLKKAEETAGNLFNERAQMIEQLETATAQSLSLSEEVEALKLERDALQNTLNTKIADLEKDLGVSMDDNESLKKKLEEASDDLDAKKARLEILEQDKTEALKQLELGEEKINANIESFKLQEDIFKAEIVNAEGAVESLRAEKAKVTRLLEDAEADNGTLTEEVNTLITERDALQQNVESLHNQANDANKRVDSSMEDMKKITEEHTKSTIALNTKITDLAKDLDVAMDDKESLTKCLEEALGDLEAKKTQLEGLEQVKNETLKQLEHGQEKHNTDIESFEMQEKAFKAEIAKSEERVESLLAEKAQFAENLENVTGQNGALTEEVGALKMERDELQQSLTSLDKFRDDIASLEDEIEHVTIEKEQAEHKLKFAEADLERTIRLQKEFQVTQTAAHDNDLVHRDGIISVLSGEMSSLRNELTKSSQKLVENDAESKEKIEMLQNEISYMREEFHVIEHKEKQTTSKLEKVKMHYAKSVAYVAEQEEEFKAKISELETTKEATEKELGETRALLANSEGTKEELQSKRVKANELEELVEQLRGVNNEMYEKNARLNASVKAGEGVELELDVAKKEKASAEIELVALKARIETLEKENASLREKADEYPASSSDVPSQWNSSPIKPVDEPPQNTTFGADDTFDESMFLPNVDEQVPVQEEATNTPLPSSRSSTSHLPPSDENKTPSKTPFKEKRALFSPPEGERASKNSVTPAAGRRMTRAMRNKMRTPLGAVGNNTPSSSRKVRTNWSNKSYC